MPVYHRLFQNQFPPLLCYFCKKNQVKSVFEICRVCDAKRDEKKRKQLEGYNKGYCPFCRMIISEHTDLELRKCLYNLRGKV